MLVERETSQDDHQPQSELAYLLLEQEGRELDRLLATRGTYKRTATRIAKVASLFVLAAMLLGVTPTTKSWAATPIFSSPVTNPFGLAPVAGNAGPSFADIDGDGDLDAFIGSAFDDGVGKYADTVFFENTGTSTAPSFGSPVTPAFGLTGNAFLPGGIAGQDHTRFGHSFVDIDGDGALDAFVSSLGGIGDLGFAANVGTAMAPAFSAPITAAFGLVPVSGGANVAVGDLDGDNVTDLVYGIGNSAGSAGDINFVANTGTAMAPAFGAASVIVPTALSSTTPALADVDGDGDLDLFFGDATSGSTNFVENVGSPLAPSWAPAVADPFGLSPVGLSTNPTFADIDADGDLDAFIGTYNDVLYFENTEKAACAVPPPAGCLTAGKTQFQINDKPGTSKDKFKWKWKKGDAFDQTALGDPLSTTEYALCVYDRSASVVSLVDRIALPAEATAPWQNKDPKGLQYKRILGVVEGITKVLFKTGAAGKSSAQMQGKEDNVTLPGPISPTKYFDQDGSITVNFVNNEGGCWTSEFTPADTKKNEAELFKAKTK